MPIGLRLDDTQHRRRRDRRIDGIAAAHENLRRRPSVASGWLDATMPFFAIVENCFRHGSLPCVRGAP